jgi:predicted Fe-Mo cluster-binding NifX family protein
MGMGAYLGIQDNGIRPIVTESESVDEAVKATKRATVFDQVDRLH